jgi:hypothetical protein
MSRRRYAATLLCVAPNVRTHVVLANGASITGCSGVRSLVPTRIDTARGVAARALGSLADRLL